MIAAVWVCVLLMACGLAIGFKWILLPQLVVVLTAGFALCELCYSLRKD